MSEQEVYQNFIDWLGKTWWGLPDSEHLPQRCKSRRDSESRRLRVKS
jgi:hypothetical protein